VHAVAIATDGTWIASAGVSSIRIWDAITGEPKTVLDLGLHTAGRITIAPDGKSLVTAGTNGVRIWDLAIGRCSAALTQVVVGSTEPTIAISPDGNWLAAAAEDGSVRIWELATRRPVAMMRIDGTARTCAWLGSQTLAVGGSGGLYAFDVTTTAR
jgi:WD40 repeat protein